MRKDAEALGHAGRQRRRSGSLPQLGDAGRIIPGHKTARSKPMERAYFLDAAVIVIRLILLCSPDANNPHHLQHNHRRSQKDKQVKLADLGSGQYVDKGKYDTAVAEKENLAGQIKTLNTTIGDLKKNNANIRRKPTKQVKLSILFFFNGHPPFWFLPEVCFSYEAYPKEVESQKQAVLQ